MTPMEANGSADCALDFPKMSLRPPAGPLSPGPELAKGSALVVANGSDFVLANGSAGFAELLPNGSDDAVVAPAPLKKANMSLSLPEDYLFPNISVEAEAGVPPETPENISLTS